MKAANYPFSVVRDEFKSKRVLVTGGTKGMGEAIVRRLTLGGGSVATIARSPLPEGQHQHYLSKRTLVRLRECRGGGSCSQGMGWHRDPGKLRRRVERSQWRLPGAHGRGMAKSSQRQSAGSGEIR